MVQHLQRTTFQPTLTRARVVVDVLDNDGSWSPGQQTTSDAKKAHRELPERQRPHVTVAMMRRPRGFSASSAGTGTFRELRGLRRRVSYRSDDLASVGTPSPWSQGSCVGGWDDTATFCENSTAQAARRGEWAVSHPQRVGGVCRVDSLLRT